VRFLFWITSIATLVWGILLVPLPLVQYAPGTSTSIPPLVAIDAETTPIEGDTQLLTIRVSQVSSYQAVRAWLSPERELERRDLVVPSGIDQSDYFRLQQQQFARSFETAVAVGLEAAGERVEVRTQAIVFAVLDGGPSDGILEAGDVIQTVDGEPVSSGDDLRARLAGKAVGDPIELTIGRNGGTEEVTVRAGMVAGLEQPGLGVAVETVSSAIDIPYDVQLAEETRIGGPSAGMMIALTVYDLMAEEDLIAGRIVAGTGTIDGEGRVGTIGGIREKVFAAVDAGADVVLVPKAQLDAARGVGADVELIGVATLDEAIEALRGD
jgi:Lon-like protease